MTAEPRTDRETRVIICKHPTVEVTEPGGRLRCVTCSDVWADESIPRMPSARYVEALPVPAPEPTRESLLVELAASIPGTCDWGDCDNNAMLARHDPERGWLPVCQWHAGNASAADLAPITAVAFEEAWGRAALPVPAPDADHPLVRMLADFMAEEGFAVPANNRDEQWDAPYDEAARILHKLFPFVRRAAQPVPALDALREVAEIVRRHTHQAGDAPEHDCGLCRALVAAGVLTLDQIGAGTRAAIRKGETAPRVG